MPRVSQAAMLLVLVVGLLAMSVAVIGSSYENTPTHVETVENETVTQDVGNWTATDSTTRTGVTGWYDNESVRNSSGDPLEEGVDYEWSTTNGSIFWYDTAATTDGADADASYAYDSRPQQASTMIGPLATLVDMSGIFPLVIVAGVAFLALKQLASTTGGPGGSRR